MFNGVKKLDDSQQNLQVNETGIFAKVFKRNNNVENDQASVIEHRGGIKKQKIDVTNEIMKINNLVPPTEPEKANYRGMFKDTRFSRDYAAYERKLETYNNTEKLVKKNVSNEIQTIPIKEAQRIASGAPIKPMVYGSEEHRLIVENFSVDNPQSNIHPQIRQALTNPRDTLRMATGNSTGGEMNEHVSFLLDVRQAVFKENIDVNDLQKIAKKYLFNHSENRINVSSAQRTENISLINNQGKITDNVEQLLSVIHNNLSLDYVDRSLCQNF
jgi:hypothetical protein